MTPELAEAETSPSPEERLLGFMCVAIGNGDLHHALQAIYHYRFDVTHGQNTANVKRVETVEWGVRHAPGGGLLTVRWCPTYGGSREPVPYTEAEARADSLHSGYPVVKRTRVTYEIDDEVSTWEDADE